MGDDFYKNLRVVNRYSYHKYSGDFAEKHFYRNYFKSIGLSFRKIRKDKIGRKPDGYIKDCHGNKIAIAEIKLVKYRKEIKCMDKHRYTVMMARRGEPHGFI